MLGLEFYYTLIFTLIVLVVCIIMAYVSLTNISFDLKQKLRFANIFGVVSFIACLDISTYAIEASQWGCVYWLDYALNYLSFAFIPLLPLLIARVLLNGKQKNWIYYLYIAYAVVLLIFTSLDMVFHVDPSDATYNRNVFFYILFVPAGVLAYTYLFICTIIINIKSISSHPILIIVLFSVLVFGMLMQIINIHIHINFLIASIVSTVFYNYISMLWSHTDGLTGLFSQYAFINMVKKAKDGSTIFMMDIDNFKKINDNYGHMEGDRVLKEIAKTVQDTFGKVGKCYRLGGDEFTVIVSKDIDPDEYSAKLRGRLVEIKSDDNISISIGFKKVEKGMSPIEAADMADKIMYKDKAMRKHDFHYKAAK